MPCIYAYTPSPSTPALVPYINVSQEPEQETVVTVRTKNTGVTAVISLPCDVALEMGLALVKHFAPDALAAPKTV